MPRFFTTTMICLFLAASCSDLRVKNDRTDNKPASAERAEVPTINRAPYDSFLTEVKYKRNHTKKDLDKFLFEIMWRDIPFYWEGTPWDFNGTTQRPRQGNIACGYFVTTVLKQLGFNINRVKLAQQASAVIVRGLCSDVKTLASFNALKTHIQSQPDSSVMVLGLDYHVGFILKQSDGNILFFHSNYIDGMGVVREPVDVSRSLRSSKAYVIGSVTQNKNLPVIWSRF